MQIQADSFVHYLISHLNSYHRASLSIIPGGKNITYSNAVGFQMQTGHQRHPVMTGSLEGAVPSPALQGKQRDWSIMCAWWSFHKIPRLHGLELRDPWIPAGARKLLYLWQAWKLLPFSPCSLPSIICPTYLCLWSNSTQIVGNLLVIDVWRRGSVGQWVLYLRCLMLSADGWHYNWTEWYGLSWCPLGKWSSFYLRDQGCCVEHIVDENNFLSYHKNFYFHWQFKNMSQHKST